MYESSSPVDDFEDRKSVISGDWAVPGAQEGLLRTVGGEASFCEGFRRPRGRPDRLNVRFPARHSFRGSLNKSLSHHEHLKS